MAIWNGFQPQAPTGSTLAQWVRLTTEFTNPDGSVAEWWKGPDCGLSFTPINCDGSTTHDFQCGCPVGCDDCGACPELPETPELPCHVNFPPFWIEKCLTACELRELTDPIRPRLEEEMARIGTWHGIAKQLWSQLATATDECGELIAEPLGDEAVCAAQALGILSHARADVGNGVILAPGYLAGAFKGISSRDSANRLTVLEMPLILDPSFGPEGPGGDADAPTEGWVYHIDQLPVAAVRNIQPSRIDHENNGCHANCCVVERLRQQAIVAFNSCRVYAIKVETCCGCC